MKILEPIYRFLRRHFVRDNRQGWKTHSLHDVLRESVRAYDGVTPDPWSEREWQEAAGRVLDHLGAASGDGERDRDVLVEAFLQGFSLSAEFALERDWLLDIGHTLCALGHWTALRWLSTLDTEPASPAHGAILGCLAMYRRTVGKLVEARSYLDRALAVAVPGSYINRWLRIERAEVLLRNNQDVEGETELTSLQEDDVFGARAKVWLALLAERRGDFGAAMEWAQQGIATGTPQIRHCHGMAGWLLLAHGRFDGAEVHFRETLAIARRSGSLSQEALALEHLAWCLGWQGDLEAIAMADEALELAEKAEYAIGIGRARCTRVLAHIGDQPSIEALDDLELATAMINDAGYRSDALNPLLVRMLVEAVRADTSAARSSLEDVVALTADVRSHAYYAEIAGWWLGAITDVAVTTAPSDRPATAWLDEPEAVRDRWVKAVKRMTKRAEASGDR